jgi:hypothetical protein
MGFLAALPGLLGGAGAAAGAIPASAATAAGLAGAGKAAAGTAGLGSLLGAGATAGGALGMLSNPFVAMGIGSMLPQLMGKARSEETPDIPETFSDREATSVRPIDAGFPDFSGGPDLYRPGLDPEQRYFQGRYYSAGGPVRFANGGLATRGFFDGPAGLAYNQSTPEAFAQGRPQGRPQGVDGMPFEMPGRRPEGVDGMPFEMPGRRPEGIDGMPFEMPGIRPVHSMAGVGGPGVNGIDGMPFEMPGIRPVHSMAGVGGPGVNGIDGMPFEMPGIQPVHSMAGVGGPGVNGIDGMPFEMPGIQPVHSMAGVKQDAAGGAGKGGTTDAPLKYAQGGQLKSFARPQMMGFGPVRMQEGGIADLAEADAGGQGQQEIVLEAARVIRGMSDADPRMVLGQFLAAFGQEALDDLIRRVESGEMDAILGGEDRMIRGNGDGMSDEIPGTIDGQQDVLLSDGEFVIPADVVSGLGNGSSDAGAKQLKAMMDRVRAERTGRVDQAPPIDPQRALPV